MREHTSRSKFYILIARNSFSLNITTNVDVTITLPGELQSCKFIFHSSDHYEPSIESPKNFTGNKVLIYEEKELRRYCDIFYE